MEKVCFIVNKEKKRSFFRNFNKNKINYEYKIEVCNQNQVKNIIKNNYKKGFKIFISCGGDGTLNNLINSIMCLDSKLKNNVLISIMPLGKANDFASNYNFNIISYEKLNYFSKKIIPIIKVNNKYFITGGCFGFTANLIKNKKELEKKKKLNKYLFNLLGSQIYTILSIYYLNKFKTLPPFKINNKKFENIIMTTIMNQKFIGKRFYFAHKKKSTDIFEIRNIKDENSFLKRLDLMKNIMKKDFKYDSFNLNSAEILFSEKTFFMGDGEILTEGKKFKFKLISKLNFLIN